MFLFPLIFAVLILAIFLIILLFKTRGYKQVISNFPKKASHKKGRKHRPKKAKPKVIKKATLKKNAKKHKAKEDKSEVRRETSPSFCGYCGESVDTPFCVQCGKKV
jgi:hypothetical protein